MRVGWIAVLVAACGGAADGGGATAGGDASPSLDAAPLCDPCVPTPRLVKSWGGYGFEPGLFDEPSSIELDSNGVVIVAGHEDRVQRFDQEGTLLDIFGTPGQGDGQFNHPHGLAVDRQRGDLVYVGDQENHRLQVFRSNGEFVRQWGGPDFLHMHDVGIDRASGELFGGDLETNVLRKFSPIGELLGRFGGRGSGPGEFNGLWGISTDSEGFVYVADTRNRRVQKLDRDGNFVKQWSGYGGVGFQKPTGVYVDEQDLIYVCDSLAERILIFDPEGELRGLWDLRDIYGEQSEPEDLVIDAAGANIFVAEVYRHRGTDGIRWGHDPDDRFGAEEQ